MLVTIYITVADYWKFKKNEVLKFYSIQEQYEKIFEELVLPEIGMLKVADVTSSDLERIVRNIFDSGKSKSVASMICAVLRKFFHQAALDKLANEKIFSTLKPITWEREDKKFFNQEQEKNLLKAFQLSKQPELYTLCMFTGIPYKDLAGCLMEDYSKEEMTLKVSRKANQYYAKARNSKPEARTIPLSEISCRVIDKAIQKQLEKNKKFPGHESNLIFTDPENKQIKRMWHGEYDNIRKRTGLHDFQLRDLVSNFGIHALKNKINPTTLKRYMGYKSDDTLNLMAKACHDNKKDIQASDKFYRELYEEGQ